MSARPMESRGIVATGVSTQFGSGCVVVELDCGGGTDSEELENSTGAVAELEFAISAELAGSCSIEELEVKFGNWAWSLELCVLAKLLNAVGELSSLQAPKRAAERSTPLKAKEIREILSISKKSLFYPFKFIFADPFLQVNFFKNPLKLLTNLLTTNHQPLTTAYFLLLTSYF